MTETPTDDRPGFVAEKPEHCHACYRLILSGQTYYLTMEDAMLCPDCVTAAEAIRLSSGLMIEVREGRLLVRRGSDTVEVFSQEVRYLVDALVETATRLLTFILTFTPWPMQVFAGSFPAAESGQSAGLLAPSGFVIGTAAWLTRRLMAKRQLSFRPGIPHG